MWPIFKKEFKSYFHSPTAYILLVVFLVVNSFFFFRSLYVQGVASLRPLFDFLPWVLLFLVPALTMRLVSEEQRQKTIDVVLAHPVRMSQFLAAKFLAAVSFLLVPLVLTVPIPLLLSRAGAFDGGQIVGQYLAAAGLVVTLVSIGLFASALTTSQVGAFLVAIAISFFFIISGLEVVVVGLSGFMRTVFEQLSILAHYEAMIRGVLDLRDVIFILSFSLCFFLLSYLLLVRPRVRLSGGAYRRLKAGVTVVIGVSIIVNLIGARLPGRFDFTRGNLYTLSVASKNFFRELPDVVTLTLYRSKSLPAQISPVDREVRDVLADIARVSRGNVRFRIVTVAEGASSESEAQRKGIVPIQFNTVASEAFTLQKGYFGITLSYADQTEQIPFVRSVNDLEYQLVSMTRKMTTTEKKKIGFLTGQGEKGVSTGLAAFHEELLKQYDVTEVSLAEGALPAADITVLVALGATQAIPQAAADALVAFVNQGGSLLVAADPIRVNPQTLAAQPNPASFTEVLAPFGISLDQNLVFDLRSQENVSFGGGFMTYVLPYPFWPRVPAVPGNPITGEAQYVSLLWSSSVSLDRTKQPSAEVFEILKTTPYAGAQTDTFQIRPDAKLPVDQSSFGERRMAVAMVLGKEPKGADAKVRHGGRIVVVGDSDFLSDAFVQGAGLGTGIVFGLNSVDWLAQDEALMSIRSKDRTPRPLVFASQKQPVVIRSINLVGIPFLVVVIGMIHLWRRRRKTKFVYQATTEGVGTR